MKIPILLIALLLTLSVFGQLPRRFDKEVDLNEWIIPTSKTEKTKILELLKDKDEFHWVYNSYKDGDTSLFDRLHVTDFNCDGIFDLIYNGFVGTESNRIIFMKGNTNGTYAQVIGLFGEFIELSRFDGFTPLSFTINNYACCAGTVNHIEKYTPLSLRTSFKYELQAKHSFHIGLKLPKKTFEKPVAFKTINEKYFLRITPAINDSMTIGYQQKGNQFAEYPKGSENIAIAEETDET